MQMVKYKAISHLSHIDTRRLLALRMSVAQLCHCGDWVQASIFSQCEWDNLKSIGKGSEAVLLHPGQSLGILHQLDGEFYLWCSTTRNQGPVNTQSQYNNQGSGDTQSCCNKQSEPQGHLRYITVNKHWKMTATSPHIINNTSIKQH